MTQPLLRKLRAWQMEVIKSENIMLTVKFIRLLYYVVGAMFPSALENVPYQIVLPYLFMLVELGGLLESSVETNVPRMQQLDILNHHQQPTSVTSGNELNGTRSPCSKEDQELNYVMPTQQGSLTPRPPSRGQQQQSHISDPKLVFGLPRCPELDVSQRCNDNDDANILVEAGPGAMEPSVAEWVLDSGAGVHVTGNLQLLQDDRNLITYNLQSAHRVVDAGGHVGYILGRGSVKTDRIEVPNVGYVKGLEMNIISVMQLARDHSLAVVFEPRYCYIMKSGGQIVGRGARSRDGMYVLEYLRIRLEDDASLSMPTGTRDADDDDGSQPQAGPDPDSCVGSDIPTVNSCCDHVCTGRSTPSTLTGTPSQHFYMDSCAYCHSTGDKSILQPYPDNLNVRAPISSLSGIVSGHSIAVDGCGYVNRDEVLQLDGVLHIPGSSVNVVSVGQLAKQYDVRVVFEKDFFRVESLQQNGVTIGQGHREKGSNLYVLDYFRPGVLLFVHSPTSDGFSVLFGNVKIPQQPS